MSMFRAAALVTTMMVGLPGLGMAQETRDPAPAAGEQAATKVSQWIADLGSDNFRTRLAAENALRKAGESALAELRRAAEQDADHEVQWRARRLVRQIERGDARGLVRRSDGDDRAEQSAPPPQRRQDAPPDDRVHRLFDQMFRDMEQRFGLDIPRARFFQDDFFRDLQEQMQSGAARSQGLSMQIGPDGAVRVEVQQRDADGKTEKKVYEAPDMDTFRQQYPDVLPQNGLDFGVRLWPDDGALQRPFLPWRRGGVDPLDRRSSPGFGRIVPPADGEALPRDVDPAAADRLVRSGDRLGVTVHAEISPPLREHLGLAADVGLMVQSVVPDSLASALGLQSADIVVRIGQQPIGSPADVQAALAGIAAGAPVPVTFLRRGVEQTATATKPAAQADDGEPEQRVLRRRSAAGESAKVR